MLSSAFLLGVVEKNKTKQNKKERKDEKEKNNNKSNKKNKKKKNRNPNSQSNQRYTPNPFIPKREDYLFSLHSITAESNIKVMKIN